MKKIVKASILVVFIIYIITFVNRNNYYETTQVLSENAIKHFEEDLKSGKEIKPSNYLPKKKEYNNKTSIFFFKLSKTIEYVVNHSIKKALNYLDNWQNNKKAV